MLHPDTVFFLGDLFDGGREWATRQGDNDEPDWAKAQRPKQEQALLKRWRRKYGDDFWLKEYHRFGEIFFKHWNDGGVEPEPGQRGRKVIASLPGNHDLGFGANIKIQVRNRFQAYIGNTNRVDVIGNHTFVSVDTVSLSAATKDNQGVDARDIYGPVEEFLENIGPMKRKAVARELRYQNRDMVELRHVHKVLGLEQANYSYFPTLDPGEGAPGFPTILLTHVPLYRDPGTPCGPLREHWPPTHPPRGQTTPVIPDMRNAIDISRGYQYQNVLSDDTSVHLVSKIGDVVSAFSGDDHDYCEVVHGADKNNVREITVKSMSWAMGVRRPGFMMLSMWNPVDSGGRPIGSHNSDHSPRSAITTDPHLCLLPDQLGIFMLYAAVFVATLLAILIRSILTPLLNLEPFSSPLQLSDTNLASFLPVFSKESSEYESRPYYSMTAQNPKSTSSSTSSSGAVTLAPRSTTARTRSISPTRGCDLPARNYMSTQPPLINGARNAWANRRDEENGGIWSGGSRWKEDIYNVPGSHTKLTPVRIMWKEAWTSVWRVAWVAALWYFYLTRYG